jgi:intracellular sulfur oxidation DsrE/DsrF family protein
MREVAAANGAPVNCRQYAVQPFLVLVLAFSLLVMSLAARAGADGEVDRILAMDAPPTGVVFEIVSDEDGLVRAVPEVRGYARRLRARFPGIHLAVVSHGAEQFALMNANRDEYRAVHEAVEVMSLREDIPVHVCATHASWRGVNPEEFASYVDVVSQGPTQVKDYLEFGYLRVVIR